MIQYDFLSNFLVSLIHLNIGPLCIAALSRVSGTGIVGHKLSKYHISSSANCSFNESLEQSVPQSCFCDEESSIIETLKINDFKRRAFILLKDYKYLFKESFLEHPVYLICDI